MKLIKAIAAIAAASFLYISCTPAEGGLSSIRERLEALENVVIPSLEEQVKSINNSIPNLQQTQKLLISYIETLQKDVENLGNGITPETAGLDERIKALEDSYATLSEDIAELQKYAQDAKDIKDWAKGTFATLEQYKTVQEDLSKIKDQIKTIGTDISKLEESFNEKLADLEKDLKDAIKKSEESIKSWVSEQLTGYYTIAEIDAKLSNLSGNSTTPGTASGVDETAREQIKDLQNQITKAKEDLTKAYTDAIESAITTNNGLISQEIATKLAEATSKIDSELEGIRTRLSGVEKRLDEVEATIKDLLARVQTIAVIPEYSDGSVGISKGESEISFEIYPLSVAESLAKIGPSAFSLRAIYTKTKAVDPGKTVNLPVVGCSYSYGILTITTEGSNLDETFFSGEMHASARLLMTTGGVSAISPYFILTPEEDE